MQCQEIQELLSEYIDGVLDTEEQNKVAEHLRKCTDCARSLSDLQDTVRLLQTLGEVAPPENFRRELRGKLEKDISQYGKTTVKSPVFLRGLVSGYKKYVAIAAALVGLGFGLYSFNQPQMDNYFGSQKMASESSSDSRIAVPLTETTAQPSVKEEISFDVEAKSAADIEQPPAADPSGAGSSQAGVETPPATQEMTVDSAEAEIANDPASAPPGMGEGPVAERSMKIAAVAEAPADPGPAPDQATMSIAPDSGAGGQQPVSSGGTAETEPNPDTSVSSQAGQPGTIEVKDSRVQINAGQEIAKEEIPKQAPPVNQTKNIVEEKSNAAEEQVKLSLTADDVRQQAAKAVNENDETGAKTPTSLKLLALTAAAAVFTVIIYYLRRRTKM